ncbi:hypothetical protein Tco_0433986, partial [Tanacetum coccineum]
VKNVVIDVVKNVVIDVVNEVVIEVVNELVVMDEVVMDEVVMDEVVMDDVVMDEVFGMLMVLDQQVCDGVQLVVLSLHLDPQLPLPT